MNLDICKSIHLIGIGGIGISALARIFLQQHKQVSGSDLRQNLITEDLTELGAQVSIGHKKENITNDIDLVIYSTAVPDDNPERRKAKQLEIKQLSYPQALNLLLTGKRGIAVAGTNGKTTVTALIGNILDNAHKDPTVVVGSNLKKYKGNARLGKSDWTVVEACEYQAHMLELKPQQIVLTNIEADHLDYYKNLDDIASHFQQFIDQLDQNGLLVLNNDDPGLQKLKPVAGRLVTYGLDKKANLQAQKIKVENSQQFFNLIWQEKIIGQAKINRPARFSVYNSLAAAAWALANHIEPQVILQSLEQDIGLWRRFQKIGTYNNCPVISDYAHLPSSISQTIEGAKKLYPEKKILAVFQPHQHVRTKKLFKQFCQSFSQADLLIVPEIFYVEGREKEKDQDISSQDLVQAITKQGTKALFAEDLEQAARLLEQNCQANQIILLIGAGDVYLLGKELFKKNG